MVVLVTNSTFTQNKLGTAGDGGGMYISETAAGTATISDTLINDTFFQNYSLGNAGGLKLAMSNSGTGACSADLYSLTFYMNWAASSNAGASIGGPANSVILDNNIFDGNTGGPNYAGPADIGLGTGVVFRENYNLVGSSDKGFTAAQDITDKANNPGLANALAANGAKPGYPQTLALANTSPGYEKGDSDLTNLPNPYNMDERGLTRQAGKVSTGAEDPDAQ